jgi:2-desacetyl-2-hydroxyethyl bacteriochlorophyllide A dehydrogenase
MKRTAIIFEKPYKVGCREETAPTPGDGEALIETKLSAISAGSELLVYRGQFPSGMPADKTIKTLSKPFEYPLKYGYMSVGEVIATGRDTDSGWRNRQIFSFHPHESHYTATLDELIPIPEDISPEEALFLPTMETAVNFVMDGKPLIGEKVFVFGQGVVGLLTTALLALFPLNQLVTFDRYAARRQASMDAGAHCALDPEDAEAVADLQSFPVQDPATGRADLVYELSGNPDALNRAIDMAGFDTRIVIGSWYGSRTAQLDLGARFHRNRIRLISSQVSTLNPDLTGRWTKMRRFDVAWEMIRKFKPASLITHEYPLSQAKKAYELLDKSAQETIQVVFTYNP